MANVTYLIGAGASAGKRGKDLLGGNPKDNRIIEGLPCVSEISTCLRGLIDNIKKASVPGQLSMWREDLLENLENLLSMSSKHATIDTYAKKLKLKQDNTQFYQVEMLLAYFFLVEQLIHKPDSRYDTFFASILNDNLEIPSHINILSWNYDSQFEIAYREYDVNKKLPIVSKSTPDIQATPKIFKVNGTASFENLSDIASLREEMPKLEDDLRGGKRLSNQGVTYIVDMYKKINKLPSIRKTRLSFAFDDTYDDEMLDKIDSIVSNTDALVIIGYTFPFFNRGIDRRMLQNLSSYTKVYIQDLFPERIKQSLKAVLPNLMDGQIFPQNDVSEFFLPPEL